MAAAHPNVLFLFTDDQRFDTIAALGNPAIHTPHIDRLVARGTAFTRAHIPGGTSGAVCMPSRAMLHTGRGLFHLEREGQAIPADHTLLGECLRQHGYQTFGTGKWHNGPAAYARSFSSGAEIFFGGMDDHWNVPACDFDPSGRYDKAQPFVRDAFHHNRQDHRLVDHIHPGVHSTDLFADATVRFLHERDRTRPFFAYTAFMAPHDPRTMPERFGKMYDPAAIDLPPNFLPEHPFDYGVAQIRDELLAARPRTPDEIRRHIAEYYAMITHLDEAIGRVLAPLEAADTLDDTIVILAGDNGLALGQHGLMGKQSLYEHSVRVPLVMAGPGIAAGRRCDELVCLLDIFPTLCDQLGVARPASVEGTSFAAALRGAAGTPRQSLYLAYCDNIRGVTTGRHKLIEYAGGQTQLFDLAADPWEQRNLAADAAQATLLAELRAELVRQFRQHEGLTRADSRRFWEQRGDLSSGTA